LLRASADGPGAGGEALDDAPLRAFECVDREAFSGQVAVGLAELVVALAPQRQLLESALPEPYKGLGLRTWRPQVRTKGG